MSYDIIIAGAGLGGLSFAHFLIENDLRDQNVLILDASSKETNDRTWSFWSQTQPSYKCAHHKVWNQLGFATDAFVKFESIDPYKYYTIRGLDLYNEVLSKIRKSSFITFKEEKVTSIMDLESHVEVKTENAVYTAKHVIESISRPNIDESTYNVSWQKFLGWTIKTEGNYFEVDKPILMDFRVPQTDSSNFVYLLPYKTNEALVEYTQFARSRSIDHASCEKELEEYISKVLEIPEFEIIEEETGAIPMTNFPFDPNPTDRIFRIGTIGGDTKPTTGYTFQNVQKRCSLIYSNITGRNLKSKDNHRFEFYDNLLLGIMENHPEKVKPIMSKLFESQTFPQILKFLDEESSILEELNIFSQLPWAPFLGQLFVQKSHAFHR
ncbi:MAG: lycopene beta-cyclase [Cyclobacteriaceae bacterium]|jgi:lycopene beta-cyclase